MEFLSILLFSLVSAISPIGLIVDQRLESVFRSRVQDVETLEVRVDNAPSYQLLQGQIQRIRLASRGVNLGSDFRLKSFALETDAIMIDLAAFQEGEFESLSQFQLALDQPLNVALKMSLAEEDINNFLASPQAKSRLEAIIQRVAQQLPSGRNQRYELLSTELQFQENASLTWDIRLRVSRRQREEFQDFNLRLVTGIEVIAGKQIALVEPSLTVDGEPLPSRLVKAFSERLSDRLDLKTLENKKITARLLQLKIEEDEVKLAAFVQMANGAREESQKTSEKEWLSLTSPNPVPLPKR